MSTDGDEVMLHFHGRSRDMGLAQGRCTPVHFLFKNISFEMAILIDRSTHLLSCR